MNSVQFNPGLPDVSERWKIYKGAFPEIDQFISGAWNPLTCGDVDQAGVAKMKHFGPGKGGEGAWG